MNLFECSSLVLHYLSGSLTLPPLLYIEIKNDISRRLESQARWKGVDLDSEVQEQDLAAVEEEEEEATILGSDEEDDDGSDNEEDSKSSLPAPSGNDIILSMKDANYKMIMFSFFQQLKVHTVKERDQDEEKRVRNEAYDFLNGLGGRMMKYRNRLRPEEGLVDVDEETARACKFYLSRCHTLSF